tara:strand:+ start:130 stop:348 length:219 start_codon:yes stop_codon:yes gene_type:complete
MNVDLELEHLLFVERKCRLCGQTKILLDDFYLTRKDRGANPSAYAYECKSCTIWRVKRNKRRKTVEADYPDW